jgi:hypothetical protein
MGKEIRVFNSVRIPHRSEDQSTDDGGPLFFIRSADRGAAHMPPAVFVDLGLEALRHSRRGTIIGRITGRAWRTRNAPRAGVLAPILIFSAHAFLVEIGLTARHRRLGMAKSL